MLKRNLRFALFVKSSHAVWNEFEVKARISTSTPRTSSNAVPPLMTAHAAGYMPPKSSP